MNIEPTELDRWARMAHHLQQSALDHNDSVSAAEAHRLLTALIRAGATEPDTTTPWDDRCELGRRDRRSDGPAARAYVVAMEAATRAAQAMELERHGHAVDGISEVLGDLAAQARFEICGPVGLRGLEG